MSAITIQRKPSTAVSTPGTMTIVGRDGFSLCTLEPPSGPERIPAATYAYKLEMSPKFERLTPHLLNVPGHSYEEIHIGNFPTDTLGCTLVGTQANTDVVWNSKTAFAQLMAILDEEGTVTYIDPQADSPVTAGPQIAS